MLLDIELSIERNNMDACMGGGIKKQQMVEKLSLTCDRLVSHLQLACCPSNCAITTHGKDLLIYSLKDTVHKPLHLIGHHGDITAMVFGTSSQQVLLCSASADYIIVWDIGCCYKRISEGVIADGRIIGTLIGKVVHLSFCLSDERVAACSGSTAYILNSKKEEVASVLTGHLGPLTAAEFCPWDQDVLVTISEDRTFKLWDLKMETVCYQSSVLSASPLLSVCFLEKSRQLVTGSAEGQVWCFSLFAKKCNLATRLDLQKIEQRHQRQLGFVAGQSGGLADVPSLKQPNVVEMAKPVLRMSAYRGHQEQERENSWLWMGSSDGLYLVDLATSELLTTLYFKDSPNLSISVAGSWALSQGLDNNMVCLVSSLFDPCVALLEVSLPGSLDSLSDLLGKAWLESGGFAVIPRAPPVVDSPLTAELKKREPTAPKKKGGVKEQSLVFHSKVKSSGYASSPPRAMFTPKTNLQKTQGTTKIGKKGGYLLRDYPEDSAVPSVLHAHLSTAKRPTPIYCFQYSGDGKQILCGLGDSTVLLYKSSLIGNPAVYTGHDKAVSSVSWSHNRRWWLSASEDRTLRLWPSGSPEPAITLATDKFSKPIKSAQFYYLDKFVLLASGPSLHLYLYHLDNTRDDVRRYQERSVIRMAKRFETSSTTDITAVSAVNDFFSYIVLACGCDRSVQVFDMNKGSVASVLPDAHSRASHCVTQNMGSIFSSQAPESYNLFVTSAITDGLKIWDLRTLRCVRRYENHLNRCHPCTTAISPCGRFIATGSEDNCAYVYDMRSSSYLHKLQRHCNTVLNVAFNPATPELLTGTLDGKLSCFRPSSGASLS